MKPPLIRCSQLGRLMTEPKTKAEGPLSIGAKTALREIAAQAIFGVDFEIRDKKIEKGNLVEAESIGLLNAVRGLMLEKNTERRSNEWITGEADLFDASCSCGHDIKSAWSLQTFPLCVEDIASSQRSAYEWQMRGYMALWDCDQWEINHCMVSTPEGLIGYEDRALHIVDHIAPQHRLMTWRVERDATLEAAIFEKVEHAREYLKQFIAEFDQRMAA